MIDQPQGGVNSFGSPLVEPSLVSSPSPHIGKESNLSLGFVGHNDHETSFEEEVHETWGSHGVTTERLVTSLYGLLSFKGVGAISWVMQAFQTQGVLFMKVCVVNFNSLPPKLVQDSELLYVMAHISKSLGVVTMGVTTTVHNLINLHMSLDSDQQMCWMVFSRQQMSYSWLRIDGRDELTKGVGFPTTPTLMSPMHLVRFHIVDSCLSCSTLFLVTFDFGQFDFEHLQTIMQPALGDPLGTVLLFPTSTWESLGSCRHFIVIVCILLDDGWLTTLNLACWGTQVSSLETSKLRVGVTISIGDNRGIPWLVDFRVVTMIDLLHSEDIVRSDAWVYVFWLSGIFFLLLKIVIVNEFADVDIIELPWHDMLHDIDLSYLKNCLSEQ
ncbi:hypothetical protein SUGI_0888400 [Cryptomeria japonica]|nr:hypothetical protein SUGI_0888400 [Cryptomeria japonica]